jgi:hypothetical protein
MSNDMLGKYDDWLTGTNGGRGKMTVRAEEYLLGSHSRYIRGVPGVSIHVDEQKGSADRRLYVGATFLASWEDTLLVTSV